MKKSWLLLFVLIILLSISGCSTTSTSSTLSSASPNSISPNYQEIAHANFCLGRSEMDDNSITFEPPLFQVPGGRFSILRMPLTSGRYKITVTTSTPESVVNMYTNYQKFVKNDKFGIPQYVGAGGSIFESNRYRDINEEVIIPVSSIDGSLSLFGPTGSRDGNCGTLIVTRLT